MQKANIQILDLEGLANHKGSLLGQVWDDEPTSQPAQKWFESQLLATLRTFDPAQPIWVESESQLIGKIQLPRILWQAMRRSPCLEIELPMAERVQWLISEYAHLIEHPHELKRLLSYLIPSHGKKKVEAWFALIDAGKVEEFVTVILEEHYDPAYRRSLPTHFPVLANKYSLANLSQDSVLRLITLIKESVL
jgi:tRNA 2-selenouridine synthase